MLERLGAYYMGRVFGLSGSFDWVSFVLALVILFYRMRGFHVKNVLLLFAHMAGIYAALLLFGGAISLMTREDIVINYLPKLIVMALYAWLFGNYKWQSRVILCASVYTINHCLIEVGGSLTGVLSAFVSTRGTEYIRGGLIFCTVAVAALLRAFNVDRFKEVPAIAVAEVLGYSIIGLSLAILRSAFMPYFSTFEGTEDYRYSLYTHLYIMITLVCIIIFIFACYFFMMRNIGAHELNMELSKAAMRQESRETMIALNESNLQQMYKIRHEIKNRYSILQGLLESKQYDRLEAYFNEINREAIVPLSRVDTGNATFDMAFNLEISKATAKNIEVNTKLIVPPEMPVSEADISGLITNLMDNAIEACKKIEEGPRLIDVTVQIVHSYLIMRISNTVAKDRAEKALSLETDKPNKSLHGYGSKIVDDIVKKYDGQILRRVEQNIFYVDVMLDIKYGAD